MELYSGDDLWLPGETALARNSCNATESAYAQSDLLVLQSQIERR
jgi:hypothetical protein